MKKFTSIFAFIFAFSIAQAQPEKWALGFKLGEPVGVVLRKYGDRNALDVTVGTYTGLLKSKKVYREGKYSDIGFMLNGTYLWFVPMFNERMIAYGGVGVQINSRKYYPDVNSKVHTNNISTGPSFTGGVEFFFAQKPTSFFIEGGGFIELLPKVFYFNPNLSLGLRHNF